jgi:putative phosphoesterase
MLIAVFSDSHNEASNVTKALEHARTLGITTGIHLGDFTSQSIITALYNSPIVWIGVWGNMDEEIRNNKTPLDIVSVDYREVTLEGRILFLTHYPTIARMAALTGKYDAVFHGHTHLAYQELLKNTLLANPGELCGTRFGKATYGIYDTTDNSFKIVQI